MNFIKLLVAFLLMLGGMYFIFIDQQIDQAALCFAIEANVLVWYEKKK